MSVNVHIEEWKKRLLDIGRTNKLINYKELRVGSLTIDTPNYKEIVNVLYNKNKSLEFIKKSEVSYEDENYENYILKEGQVITKKSDSELKKSLDSLRLKAKSSLEEQGVNILYLAIGFLEWIDKENKESKSPILLFPVKIIQGNIFENNKLMLSGEEVVINPALQLKFESEYNILLKNPSEDDLEDIDKYFNNIEKIINNSAWNLNKQVELGTFSFQKISMYKDFDELENERIDNKIVSAITGEKVEINSKEIINTLESDVDIINPNEVFQVLDADSSQQEAILAAKRGLSFVMQGPPGTGKSQTITNIIAECLSMGKSVLFVSEKLAALNVVYNKLKQVGLEEFCLQLHSNKSNKKDIIRELAETLNKSTYNDNSNYTSTLNNLYKIREELNLYTKELNRTINPFGKSLYEAYGVFNKYSDVEDLNFNYEYLEDLTEEKIDEYINLVTSYSVLFEKINTFNKEDLWKYYCLDEIDEDKIKNSIEETILNLNLKSDIVQEIKTKFNLSIEDNINSFSNLAKVLEIINRCDDLILKLVSVDNLEDLLNTFTTIKNKYNNIAEIKEYIDKKYSSEIYRVDYLDTVTEAKSKEEEYLRFVDREKIKVKDRRELSKLNSEKLEFAINFAQNINSTVSLINNTCNLNLSTNNSELELYNELFKLIVKDYKINEKLFDNFAISVVEKLIVDYKNKCNKISDYKNKLSANFDKDLLEINIKEILIRFRSEYTSSLKILKSNYRKDVKLIKGFYKSSEKLTDQIIVKALEICKDIKDIEVEINELQNKLKHYLDIEVIDEYTDWNSIRNSINIIKEIKAELEKLGQEENETIKRIIISSDREQKISKIIEEIEYIKSNTDKFNSYLKEIYYENSINSTNSIIKSFEALLKYKEYFNPIDMKLSEIVKNSEVINYDDLKNDISKIRKMRDLEDWIKDREKFIPENIFDNEYNLENISKVIANINKAIIYKKNLNEVKANKFGLKNLYKNDTFKQYISINIDRILDIDSKLNKNFIYINSLLSKNLNTICKEEGIYFNKWLSSQLDGILNIRTYKDYYKVKENINSFGVTGVNVDDLVTNRSIESLVKSINKRFISLWINYQSNKISIIRDFNKEVYDLKVKNFKVIDKEQLIIAKKRLKKKLSIERPNGSIFSNKNNEVTLLLHESNKKRMHLPIRRLFSTIPNLIFKLKPCFLMSPLAVSSFLDINEIKFDVVIFDEASQICPEDALGSMIRSKQVIIVGDSEQLPPTSFFTTSILSDELNSDDSGDLHESILDKCSTIMPTVNLKWHYRSRHEDLISFSNKNIYKNLITIPSAIQRNKDLGVEFIKVDDAYYERSGSRVNRKEADVVANLVFEHFKNSPNKSLGVVTFSESQSTAIETALRKLRESNQELEAIFSNDMFSEDVKEPFFIKNIESVQGDERDVIIFSIGYGKDIYGNMSMNFGPLSRSGGYRRLNVAITRAKYNVKVVSSIEPNDIDLSRTNSDGVKMLKYYMEFAKSGDLHKEDEIVNKELNSKVEKAIYDLLIDNGYKVDFCVGASDYKIDIAVKSPLDENKYILAIELDGSYKNKSIARERYRLREELLQSMGWNFYRIWSTEWIRNREKVENELLSYLSDISSKEKELQIYNESLIINDINIDDLSYSNEVNLSDTNVITKEYDTSLEIEKEEEEVKSIINYDDILSKDINDIDNSISNQDIKEKDVIDNTCTESIKDKKDYTISDYKVETSELEKVNFYDKEDNKVISEEKLIYEHEVLNIKEIENKNVILGDINSKRKNIIKDIVKAKSPIHINNVCEELLTIENLERITSSYKKFILEFIKVNLPNIEIRDKEFLWEKNSLEISLRNDIDYKREIREIPKEEIALSMINILESGPKNKQELFKEVLNFFGETSSEKSNERYLIEAIDLLFEENKLELKYGNISLKNYNSEKLN